MNLDVFFKSKITAEDFVLLSVVQQNSNGSQRERLLELDSDYSSISEYVKFVNKEIKMILSERK